VATVARDMTQPSRQVPTGWRLVVVVGCLSVFGPLCIDMYLPAFPSISRDLHASASQVQLTLTACLIGLSLGQLLFGPISDRLGRRPPLLAGLTAFVASSIACAFAPNVYVLAGFRVVQGLGGAAGLVISRSIVRDLRSGDALVRFFSTLMLMTGLGPLLAPQIGSVTLSVTSWRGIFLVLAAFGLLLLLTAWLRVPETLAPTLRASGTLRSTIATMISVARDRVFVGYALAQGLAVGATFAYIAGSSFVLQNVYGLSPGMYGIVFALNAGGLIVGAQVNGKLTGRYGPSVLLNSGLVMMITGGVVLVIIVASGVIGLAGVVPSMVLFMFGGGFVAPSALGLALQRYPQSAGAAAGLIGCFQFLIGAAIAPLAGTAGTADALPMAVLMLTLPIAGLAGRLLLAGAKSEVVISPAA
jgi:DHA1 family bicyclomycin/chloramphenicol resistance-like MFS transporter